MHIAVVCLPATGHVNPTLPVVAELVRRGHRVTYATSEKYADAVRATGAAFFASGTDFTAQLPRHSLQPPAGGSPGAMMNPLMSGLMQRLLLGAREEFPVLLARLAADPPDALCYDAMTLAGKMAAAKLNVPDIALLPTYASNEHFSMRELMPERLPAAALRAWKEAREQVSGFAAEQGLENIGFMDGVPASLNISFIPRAFQPAGDTFDGRFHFVGPCLGKRVSTGSWQAPAAGPLLFISLGTTPLNDRPDFFRMCLQAFGNSRWQVAIATGEQIQAAELGAIPANVDVRPFFPQLEVLRHASVFLSHTGMNSTMESLYFGVPLVAVPQQPEQAANARRVEELGLGRRLDPATLSAALLRSTVEEVDADQRIRGNVHAMSASVRAAGGPEAAADAIEGFLRAQGPPPGA
ncbi:macrolide family glycosyltransferase [Pseudarthrobacter sp. P1]|uniref:macrolide family glycosyltransferase n=1 Tax=Pseudarthrobacter sp. P1 TaxID=3418418 RepID=UPI003CF26D47